MLYYEYEFSILSVDSQAVLLECVNFEGRNQQNRTRSVVEPSAPRCCKKGSKELVRSAISRVQEYDLRFFFP